MNKAELIAAVAEKTGSKKTEAEATINTVLDTIVAGAKADGECVVPGIGKLKVVDTPAKAGGAERVAPNGTKYVTKAVPAGKKIKLELSKAGKELV